MTKCQYTTTSLDGRQNAVTCSHQAFKKFKIQKKSILWRIQQNEVWFLSFERKCILYSSFTKNSNLIEHNLKILKLFSISTTAHKTLLELCRLLYRCLFESPYTPVTVTSLFNVSFVGIQWCIFTYQESWLWDTNLTKLSTFKICLQFFFQIFSNFFTNLFFFFSNFYSQ